MTIISNQLDFPRKLELLEAEYTFNYWDVVYYL